MNLSQQINHEQQEWMSFSKTLSDKYGQLKSENQELKTKLKKEMGSQNESPLIQDLKHSSLVECLGQLSHIEELRSTNFAIRKRSDFKDLESALQKLLHNADDTNTSGDSLTLKSIFSNRPLPQSGLDPFRYQNKLSIDRILSTHSTPDTETKNE